MKLVHAADLHLDSPLLGLERYEGVPAEQLRGATRGALENLVDTCLEEEAKVLLLSGDLYDGDWKDYSTGLFFSAQMSRLRAGGVQVALIRGNHDAASQITRRLQLPANVVELPAQKPGTHVFESLGVAVHGQSFGRPHVTEDLASGYPEPVAGLLNIGLLHTALTGRPGHDPYAPCSLETLVNRGYDYWALGHVHQQEVVCEEPWVVFPGNLQGRHARERGAKGAMLLHVEAGRVARLEQLVLDTVRWEHVEVRVAPQDRPDVALELVRHELAQLLDQSDERLLAVRVTVAGAGPALQQLQAHRERWVGQLRADATDLGPIWVEKLLTKTLPELDHSHERQDVVGELVRALRALPKDAPEVEALLGELAPLARQLPRSSRGGGEALGLDQADWVHALLPEAEQLLLGRLLPQEDES